MPSATTPLHEPDGPGLSRPSRISVKRSPDAVRAIVHQLLEQGERCLPEDLRTRHHVVGGSTELNELIGEVRNSLRASPGELAPRIAVDPTGDLPPEFRPVQDLVRRAALTFVSRIEREMHRHMEIRVTAAEQEAAVREEALQQELDLVREQAHEIGEALAKAHAEAERQAASLGELDARLAEHAQHQVAMGQSAEDLRAALQGAEERMRAADVERDLLRARGERADIARMEVESEKRTLLEALRSQADELRAAQAAVVARTQEATTMQRMLEGVVATNAALVARLEVPAPPLIIGRTRRAPTKGTAATTSK